MRGADAVRRLSVVCAEARAWRLVCLCHAVDNGLAGLGETERLGAVQALSKAIAAELGPERVAALEGV